MRAAEIGSRRADEAAFSAARVQRLINEGAQTLIKLRNKIDTDKMKGPSFLMVLVGIGSLAYRRDDGVYVVPIGCLKD